MSIEGVKGAVITPHVSQPEPAKRSVRPEPIAAEKPKPAEEQARAVPANTPDIEAVVAQIDRYLKSVSRSLEFRVDGPGGHTVVSVRDTETGDLIRQFPGEEVLRLAEMAEEQTIVLVREKV